MSMHTCGCDGCGRENIIKNAGDVLGSNYEERAKGKAVRIRMNEGSSQAHGYDDPLLCTPCFSSFKNLLGTEKTDGVTCSLCGKEKGYNFLFHISNVFPENADEESWRICEECKYKVLPMLGENPFNTITKGTVLDEEPSMDNFYR